MGTSSVSNLLQSRVNTFLHSFTAKFHSDRSHSEDSILKSLKADPSLKNPLIRDLYRAGRRSNQNRNVAVIAVLNRLSQENTLEGAQARWILGDIAERLSLVGDEAAALHKSLAIHCRQRMKALGCDDLIARDVKKDNILSLRQRVKELSQKLSLMEATYVLRYLVRPEWLSNELAFALSRANDEMAGALLELNAAKSAPRSDYASTTPLIVISRYLQGETQSQPEITQQSVPMVCATIRSTTTRPRPARPRPAQAIPAAISTSAISSSCPATRRSDTIWTHRSC